RTFADSTSTARARPSFPTRRSSDLEHRTADGRRLLVTHGDQFDVITRYHRWLAFLGDHAYEFSLRLNRWLNYWRSRCGYGYWSLDRKSTRLNSSHVKISYAVFCLQK